MRIGNNTTPLQQYSNVITNQNNSADSRLQSKQKRQLISALNSTTEKKEDYSNRIINDSLQYAQTVSAARTSKKNANLQSKKVKYNYKSISTQITRAKTSASAKQVVIKAKRLVSQLKRQQASGEYDSDELQAAIDHAKAMERVAKKKVNHLVEEEMAKASGGACLGEEKESVERDERTENEDQEALEEYANEDAEMEIEENIDIDFEAMEEFSSDMQDAMSEMLEEDLMEELQDSMGTVVKKDMDPADLDMLKLKHRTKEQKEIAKADAKYLKAVFDKLQADRQKAVAAVAMSSGGSGSENYNQLGGVVSNSIPGAEGAYTGGINICV